MKFAIIGCGGIGRKRAMAIRELSQDLIACADIDKGRASQLAQEFGSEGCRVFNTDDEVFSAGPDVVICATPHDSLVDCACAAAAHGAHVLIEKPGARWLSELQKLKPYNNKVTLRFGYNLRYHPAMQKAAELLENHYIGTLRFFRGKYGHGGRVGYEKEWRCNPQLSGGGVAVDMLVHLIDLVSWFSGGLPLHCDYGLTTTEFWDSRVEDNAVVRIFNCKAWALLQASWTEWKNTFQFELVGDRGKIEINGIGGSYGTERLTLYEMSSAMGPPNTTTFEWPQPDSSWKREVSELLTDIRWGRPSTCGLSDAMVPLEIVDTLYAQNHVYYNVA